MKKYLNYYRPGTGESWFIIVVVLLIGGNILASLLMGLSIASGQGKDAVLGYEGWKFLITYLIPFIVFAIFLYFRVRNRAKVAQMYDVAPYDNPKPSFGHLPLYLLLPLLLILVPAIGYIIEPLTSWMTMPDFLKELFEKMGNNDLPTFLSVVIAAPLCEEFALRGVCLRGMLQRNKNARMAIFWTAIMFAVLHMNPWQAIPAFILGYLFGWIFMRTRCLWLCIFMHAVNNGLSFAMSALFPDIDMEKGWIDLIPGAPYYIVYACCILLVAGIIWLLNKKLAPAPVLTPRSAKTPFIEQIAQ